MDGSRSRVSGDFRRCPIKDGCEGGVIGGDGAEEDDKTDGRVNSLMMMKGVLLTCLL